MALTLARMPQDLLEIGLEHHRAGRLRQAEASYRQLIEREPAHADAHHWLGVLMHQAGRSDDAVMLLERAAALRPGDGAFQHNLGHVYLGRRQHDAAVQAFDKAATAEPARAEAWMGLGLARLARGQETDAEGAVEALQKARAGGIDTAELHHHLGVALLAAGKTDDAMASFRAALAKEPEDPSSLYHLALAYQSKGESREVRKLLLKAAEINPGFARAWHGLGVLEAEAEKWEMAAAMFRRAIAAKHDYAAAYDALAQVLQKLGRTEEAERIAQQVQFAAKESVAAAGARRNSGSVEELERKVTPDKSALELHYALAALTKVAPPHTVPPAAIIGLFDKYAEKFDDHLQNTLLYNVPKKMAEAIFSLNPASPLDILDLGCGTGLCGPLLKPLAKTLVGVDLSPNMVEKARERGVYDRFIVADLIDAMRQMPRSFDLLVSTDVLIYIGDLMLVFEAAASALRPGGRFAFSVEAGAAERYDLHKNRRYAHSKGYLQRLAAMYAFEEQAFADVILRIESLKPVAGYLVILRLPE